MGLWRLQRRLEGLENGGHMLYHHNVFTTTPSPMRVPRSKTTNGTWRSSVCVLFLVISPLQSNKWNLEKRPSHIATQKQLMEPCQAAFSTFASHIAGGFVSHRKSSQFQLVKDKQSSAPPRLSSFSQLQWLGKGRKILINRFQDSSSRLIEKTRPSVRQSIDVGLLYRVAGDVGASPDASCVNHNPESAAAAAAAAQREVKQKGSLKK